MIEIFDHFTDKYKKYKNKTIEDRLFDYIRELTDYLKLDIGKVILFNKNFVLLKIKYVQKDVHLGESILAENYISNVVPSVLNIVREKKKAIFFEKDGDDSSQKSEYIPLIQNTKQEIYIPLFKEYEKQSLIGCIYLATFDEEKKIKLGDLDNDNIIYQIYRIAGHLEIIYQRTERYLQFLNTIHILTTFLQYQEPFMPEHSYNVASWAKEIAERLSLDEARTQQIYIAGLLHDIGKVYVHQELLRKPGKLTDEEYEIVKNHSLYSYYMVKDIVRNIPEMHPVSMFIKYHHERYDGKGYPEGLKGNEVPIESSILSVANAIDAMLSQRPYRDVKSLHAVISELTLQKGKQFHPKVVDAALKILVDSKSEQDRLFSCMLIQATAAIDLKDGVHFVQGKLMKIADDFVFKIEANQTIDELEKTDIRKIDLYLKDSHNIFECSGSVKEIRNDTIYISNLQLSPRRSLFNILWDLHGVVVCMDGKKQKEIYDVGIYKIGPNALSFCIDDDQAAHQIKDKIIYMQVYFDEDMFLDISGQIIKNYRMGSRYHFDFDYSNLHDSKKDLIYKYLFQKQAELKRTTYSFWNLHKD